jgi:riboflavin kinase/FMN adenylyltransferase
MKVISSKLPSKKRKTIATIGTFDGIHLGHQFILKKVKNEAAKKGLNSLVITFDSSVKKSPGLLTDFKQKISLMSNLGLDYLWVLKMNKTFSKLSADDFIRYISGHFLIEKLIVGDDFRFGYRRQADIRSLKSLSVKYNFKLSIVKKKTKDRKIISSSLIRGLIKKGKLKEAEKLLGRKFSFRGKVVKGKGLGRRINFPTANIFPSDYILPPQGIYAAAAVFKTRVFLAAVNIGLRPTVSSGAKKILEAHIIKFNKNILGKFITIVFLGKIREEKKFDSLQQLKLAIEKDIKVVTAKYSTLPSKHPQLLVV